MKKEYIQPTVTEKSLRLMQEYMLVIGSGSAEQLGNKGTFEVEEEETTESAWDI